MSFNITDLDNATGSSSFVAFLVGAKMLLTMLCTKSLQAAAKRSEASEAKRSAARHGSPAVVSQADG